MKHVVLFFLLIQYNIGYSQFFVGGSKESVKIFLENNGMEFSESQLTDTTSRISVIEEGVYQMIYVLDSVDIVLRQTLIPDAKAKSGLNGLVSWFNEDFVRISDVEWRNYANGRIYRIKLGYILGEPLFSITLSPDSK